MRVSGWSIAPDVGQSPSGEPNLKKRNKVHISDSKVLDLQNGHSRTFVWVCVCVSVCVFVYTVCAALPTVCPLPGLTSVGGLRATKHKGQTGSEFIEWEQIGTWLQRSAFPFLNRTAVTQFMKWFTRGRHRERKCFSFYFPLLIRHIRKASPLYFSPAPSKGKRFRPEQDSYLQTFYVIRKDLPPKVSLSLLNKPLEDQLWRGNLFFIFFFMDCVMGWEITFTLKMEVFA